MKTLNLFLLFALVCITTTSCSKKITGSGVVAQEERSLSNSVDALDISSIVEVTIVQGENASMVVTADDNIFNEIITRVSGNRLVIDLEGGNYKDITAEVLITMPNLERIDHDGVSDTEVSGFEDLDELEIESSGVGDIIMNGSADKLVLDYSGVGNFKGFNFEVGTLELDFSGVGDVEITANDLIEGELDGVGDLEYKGYPTINVEDNGVGKIKNRN